MSKNDPIRMASFQVKLLLVIIFGILCVHYYQGNKIKGMHETERTKNVPDH